MTKEEAAAILGVFPFSEGPDVQKRFQELYSDFQIRLTNAPTTALKKTYQKNLQDLQAALETLCPGASPSLQRDLPASEPVMVSGAGKAPAPAFGSGKTMEAGKPTKVVRPVAAEPGLPRSTVVAASIAILLASLSAFLAIKWAKAEQLERALRGTTADQIHALQAVQGQAEGLKKMLRLLENGNFQVCNASSGPMKITWLSVTYRDKTDAMKTWNSAYYGYPTWELSAGGRKKFNFVRGQEEVWDGSALFYAMTLSYKGNEYSLSGAWSNVKGDCVQIGLE